MNSFDWYNSILKPSWAPPNWLFGTVWSVLYPVIFVSFAVVFYRSAVREIPLIVALPFALNLLFNFVYSPIQFGMRNNFLASVDIVLVVVTLVWALIAIWPYARWVSLINIPYLLWGSYAMVLQFTITYLNWK